MPGVSRVMPPPGVAEVARIAALSDRVVRHLEITWCYARLSEAMRGRIGEAADWCTFATWASRQAGSTIRGEDLFDRLERRLRERARLLAPLQSLNRALLRRGLFAPETRLGRAVAAIHTPFDAFERASDAVAAGNLKVFDEIAREFARFLATVPADAPANSREFEAFSVGLRRGPPPEGQQYLREAFAHYQQQRHEPDLTARAGWILLANLKIGLHEQTRLQPQIAAALDAPLVTARDLGMRVLRALFPASHRWPGWMSLPAAALLGSAAIGVHRAATRLTREVLTEAMMVLRLPDRVLALGRDLDTPVPPVLAGAAHPFEEFVREHDPCTPGTNRSGADDWCDLRQRMHYIVHLFRAFAVERSLFTPPFTADQIARFRAGSIPDGAL